MGLHLLNPLLFFDLPLDAIYHRLDWLLLLFLLFSLKLGSLKSLGINLTLIPVIITIVDLILGACASPCRPDFLCLVLDCVGNSLDALFLELAGS